MAGQPVNTIDRVYTEYIWFSYDDFKIRSKIKILNRVNNNLELPLLCYDGYKTNEIKEKNTNREIVLKPWAMYNNPFKNINLNGKNDKYLILCDSIKNNESKKSYRLLLDDFIKQNNIKSKIQFGLEFLIKSDVSNNDDYCSVNNGNNIITDFLNELIEKTENINANLSELYKINSEKYILITEKFTPIISCNNLLIIKFLMEKISEKYNIAIKYNSYCALKIFISDNETEKKDGLNNILDKINKCKDNHSEIDKVLEDLKFLNLTYKNSNLNFGIGNKSTVINIPILTKIANRGNFVYNKINSYSDPFLAAYLILSMFYKKIE